MLAVYGPTLEMVFGVLLTWVLINLLLLILTLSYCQTVLLTLAAIGLGINSFHLYTTASAAIWGYIGFLCLWIIYYLYKIVTGKEGMGYGDFKLLATLVLGWGP